MIMPNGIAVENQLYGRSVLTYLKNKCWMYSETQRICSFQNYTFKKKEGKGGICYVGLILWSYFP